MILMNSSAIGQYDKVLVLFHKQLTDFLESTRFTNYKNSP